MIRKVAVVGGGIVGASVAYSLTVNSEMEVVLLDKESEPAKHQTGHNSGVVHAGLYYQPGSLKAQLCRRGVTLLREYCKDREIPYEERGKLVVARTQEEVARLEGIQQRAAQNRVPGIEWLSRQDIREVEPQVEATAALLSPHTAIVDFAGVARSLIQDAKSMGAETRFGVEVHGFQHTDARVRILTSGDDVVADAVIVCAGLQSDRLAASAGGSKYPEIVPFYGEYFLLNHTDSQLVNHAIYPVPDPKFPFLGVHITPRLDGRQMIGPNAFLSLARERYDRTGVSVRDLGTMARSSGFWRMAGRNVVSAAKLLPDAFSARGLLRGAQDLVPRISGSGIERLERGVRAQAVTREGLFEDDFVVHQQGQITFLRNAPSPGATSALALGEHLCQHIRKQVDQ